MFMNCGLCCWHLLFDTNFWCAFDSCIDFGSISNDHQSFKSNALLCAFKPFTWLSFSGQILFEICPGFFHSEKVSKNIDSISNA